MRRKNFTYLVVAFLLAMALTACGASSGAGSKATPTPYGMDNSDYATMSESGDYYDTGEVIESPAYEMESGENSVSGEEVPLPDGAKRIYTATLELETLEFDESIRTLEALVTSSGGYLESSDVNSRGSGYHYANYTIRVPQAQYESFLNQAGALCHQLSIQENVQDVSESYYDTEGRLKTQKIKLERLQDLLSKADKMEDIVTLVSAISETEQQIDALSGTLRHYDALVNYSTVYIYLNEVYKLSNVEEAATGFSSRIGSAFVTGWKDFVDAVEDLSVALAYSWMWLVVLVLVVVFIIHRARRGGKKKAAMKAPSKPPIQPIVLKKTPTTPEDVPQSEDPPDSNPQ